MTCVKCNSKCVPNNIFHIPHNYHCKNLVITSLNTKICPECNYNLLKPYTSTIHTVNGPICGACNWKSLRTNK